jgi:ribonucleoside-diphosphate reductase alpha chain
LLPYEACTLGSINVAKFVNVTEGQADMNWPALAETVKLAVRFLDNIVEVCNYPIRDTLRLAHDNRKIGLGVMGFADCLFALGIPYDSKQGVEFGAELMKFVNDKAHEASAELAGLRGPFPNFKYSIWQTGKSPEIRNASITCVAPTGTISIIADCSSGIEPVYSLVFLRQVLDDTKMLQIDTVFKRLAEKRGFYTKKLEKQIARTGSIQKMTGIPAEIRRIFRGAYDIKPQWHIQMQAAFQQHCDAAVSKTINFSEKATVSAVDKAYKAAYRLGCKGVTVYRQHSRQYQPMSLY